MVDNFKALATIYDNVQAQRSQVAQYALSRAGAYLQENKYDEALQEFKKVLAFDPQNTDAHTYMGKIYLSQGKTREAIASFKNVVRININSAAAQVDLANAYIQDKQYGEAENALKKGARLDTLNPLPNYTLGHLYVQTDRLKEAQAQFQKVAKISPRDGNVYYSLGLVDNKMGNPEDAIKNLEKALTLKKDFPAANYELGMAYNAVGRTEDAEDQLSILDELGSPMATDLAFTLNKPKILYMDNSKGGFNELLGAGTPLWMLDPTLLTAPNSSKKLSIDFQFTNEMDLASVINPSNWTISRANDTNGGFYNNTMPVKTDREVSIPTIPMGVIYNPLTNVATISFMVKQNADGNATIDASHLVFKFSGKDAAGREMDTSSDQVDGYAGSPF